MAAVLFVFVFLAPLTSSASPIDTIYRSNVELNNNRRNDNNSPNIVKVINRFHDTLNGVTRPRSSYYGGGGGFGQSASRSRLNDDGQLEPSTLSALLRVIDRLQNMDTTPTQYRNPYVGDGGSYANVGYAGSAPDAKYMINSVDSVEVWPNETTLSDVQTTVQPRVLNDTQSNVENVTVDFVDSVTEVAPDVTPDEEPNVLNASAVTKFVGKDSVVTSHDVANRTSMDNVTLEVVTEASTNDSDVIESVIESSNETSSENVTEKVGEMSLGEYNDDVEELDDPMANNVEERFAAFMPSPELVRGVTQSPDFLDRERESDEIIAEPNGAGVTSAEDNVTAGVTSAEDNVTAVVEVTTLSSEELFNAKPFLESLVNLTSMAEDDLSAVTAIAISQSSIATSSNLTDDDPDFVFDRNSPQFSQLKTCSYNHVVYLSGQNVDQSDPCHFCVCIDGEISCYWKNCPPAPDGCVDLEFEGVCQRSLYLCPIPVKGQPLPFADNSVKKTLKRDVIAEASTSNSTSNKMTCDILGVEYRVGELVGVASDPCMECRCALDSLYCSPKCCFQPTVDEEGLNKSEQDPSKSARAEDPIWFPVLANPLMHLRSEFEKNN